jgi:hypothetical protein
VYFNTQQAATAHVAAKTAQTANLANSSLSNVSSTADRDIQSSNMAQSLASVQTAADVKPAPVVTTSAAARRRSTLFDVPAAGASVVAPGSFIGIPSTWQFNRPTAVSAPT